MLRVPRRFAALKDMGCCGRLGMRGPHSTPLQLESCVQTRNGEHSARHAADLPVLTCTRDPPIRNRQAAQLHFLHRQRGIQSEQSLFSPGQMLRGECPADLPGADSQPGCGQELPSWSAKLPSQKRPADPAVAVGVGLPGLLLFLSFLCQSNSLHFYNLLSSKHLPGGLPQ